MATTTTVCITGASGFIASHIVKQCLEKGWKVNGTVRSLTDESKVGHLKKLPNADTNLQLFEADLITKDAFVEPLKGCDGVFHTASPVLINAGSAGKDSIYMPTITGTRNILEVAAVSGIKTFVLTSSMSAIAPVPEPDVKSEAHWSDSEVQKSKDNWYGAAKTDQEKMCHAFVAGMPEETRFRFCAICPTAVMGPMLQPKPNSSMTWLQKAASGDMMKKAPNDSMSFIDVRDCAALHVAAFENSFASGRYMCLDKSYHWNDIFNILKKLNPSMSPVEAFEGDLAKATQFDRTRQDSLGVTIREVPQILEEAFKSMN